MPTVRRSIGGTARADAAARAAVGDADGGDGGLSRRGLLVTVAGAAGVLTLVTAGQTVPALRRLTLLAPRRPDIGPQGFPVNRSASAAGTTTLGDDPAYRLVVSSPAGEHAFTVDELRRLPQHSAELPIACVEGWSASATWTGVRMADVLVAAGARPGAVTVGSAQQGGLYASSELTADAAAGDTCLLALQLNGEDLHADHGAPVRLIAPDRPGVLQTKWVTRLDVS
jgi:DMSO/TMAO reductase YedYZ molybdopterin-dependent catalytic subunit